VPPGGYIASQDNGPVTLLTDRQRPLPHQEPLGELVAMWRRAATRPREHLDRVDDAVGLRSIVT
jgi:hypothetical protein